VGTVPATHDDGNAKKAIQYHTLQGAQGVYRRLVAFLLQSVHLVSEVFNQRSAERQAPATEKKLATMVQQGLVRAQAAFHITTGTWSTSVPVTWTLLNSPLFCFLLSTFLFSTFHRNARSHCPHRLPGIGVGGGHGLASVESINVAAGTVVDARRGTRGDGKANTGRTLVEHWSNIC